MKAKWSLVFMMSSSCLYCHAQTSNVNVRNTKPGEISFETAVSKLTAIVNRLGFQEPIVVESRCRIARNVFGSKFDLQTKNGVWIAGVDSVTGRITSLYHQKRRREQYEGRGRTGAQFFASEQAAKNHLRMIATKLGVPSEAKFSKLGWKRDGEVRDANTAGSVYANYKIPGREWFVVEVDPQDGVFVSFRHTVKSN